MNQDMYPISQTLGLHKSIYPGPMVFLRKLGYECHGLTWEKWIILRVYLITTATIPMQWEPTEKCDLRSPFQICVCMAKTDI